MRGWVSLDISAYTARDRMSRRATVRRTCGVWSTVATDAADDVDGADVYGE